MLHVRCRPMTAGARDALFRCPLATPKTARSLLAAAFRLIGIVSQVRSQRVSVHTAPIQCEAFHPYAPGAAQQTHGRPAVMACIRCMLRAGHPSAARLKSVRSLLGGACG